MAEGKYDSLSAVLIENENAAEVENNVIAATEASGTSSVAAKEGASVSNTPTEAVSKSEKEEAADIVNASSKAASENITTQSDFYYEEIVTQGLPDETFDRGSKEQGLIPMTKREIRSISLSRLQLKKDSVCWDIGAGTGSVAIEMARQASAGKVYAIEKEPAAVQLTKHNVRKLRTSNVTVVEGEAPEVLQDLPAPTHVFIGGSAGNIREIIGTILFKNPTAVIVATAIALDTIAEITSIIRESAFTDSEVTAVNVSNDRKAGNYRLMSANNPVYIFTIRRNDQ